MVGIDINEFQIENSRYQFINASIFDLDSFPFHILSDNDILIYLVATTTPSSSLLNISTDIERNLTPFVAFLEKLVGCNMPKIIYASSGGAIYSQSNLPPYSEKSEVSPVSPYGINKLSAEMYLKLFNLRFGLPYICLRISNPYGEGQYPKPGFGVIPAFVSSIYALKPITVYGSGESVRDFIYISDLVNAFILTAKSKNIGIYNIGTGEPVAINDLIVCVEKATQCKFEINTLADRPSDLPSVYLDISKFKQDFDWRPEVTIKQGIENYLKWYKKLNL